MESKSEFIRYAKIFLSAMVVSTLVYGASTCFVAKNDLCKRGSHVATIGSELFVLHALDTPEERTQGLSGKSGLAPDEGELFIFDAPTEIGFWMKDMNFPIDILYLDSDKKVVGLVADLKPETYPNVYMSPQSMRYAVEVTAGVIVRTGIAIGDTVKVSDCTKRF